MRKRFLFLVSFICREMQDGKCKRNKYGRNVSHYLICCVMSLKVFLYLQDIRQIPIIVNRPMITTTSWIMYVWWLPLESTTEIQHNFTSFALYLHITMRAEVRHRGCTYWCRIWSRCWATNPEDRDTWSRSSTDRARHNGNRSRNRWSQVWWRLRLSQNEPQLWNKHLWASD